jgi:hypothetical protein
MAAFRRASQQRVADMQTRLERLARASATAAAQFGETATAPQTGMCMGMARGRQCFVRVANASFVTLCGTCEFALYFVFCVTLTLNLSLSLYIYLCLILSLSLSLSVSFSVSFSLSLPLSLPLSLFLFLFLYFTFSLSLSSINLSLSLSLSAA